ncbi:hypothetical protein [Halorubrum vacuolatum]|uniref:Uncharacterized protein n=1 Tax=Halorubrum vacuolatum TaxID=63740 RepID=A0A238UX84_HALVU|nr:hypothetical protein [Halorubrum vacuolatum]SNR26347.1 hypothetical protein SAMN06264855_101475 [Halorubrum vacuolatum]
MSYEQQVTGRIDLDAAFKAFGAVGILIAVVLTGTVVVLTNPFGGLITASPAVIGTVAFTLLLVAVGYTTFALRSG